MTVYAKRWIRVSIVVERARDHLLEVNDLTTVFRTVDGIATAVDGVSYAVEPGETLAVVGESGSGKSVTALSIMGLVPNPPGQVVGGQVWYGDTDLLTLTEAELQQLRGADIAMIFQEPMTSLNPVLTIERQLTETIVEHQGSDSGAARQRALEMLRLVQIPEPERRLSQYPHQLSGGMLQRVMIAMALSCNPKILIADEPTTALDVTIQSQILALMQELQQQFGTAIVLITHDLGVVAETADRVVVMYAGRVVEEASVYDLFDHPQHPYTRGLLAAIPRLGVRQPEGSGGSVGSDSGEKRQRLSEISGIVPALTRLPTGCRFAPRCPLADQRCRSLYPALEEKRPGQRAACWHSEHAV